MSGFTHFDEKGNAVMVDVHEKADTYRVAVAQGTIQRGGFSGNHKSHGKKGGCSRYRENRRNHGGEKERGVDSVVPYYCTDRL